MGGNRRYPHNAARLAEEREVREARARGPLQSLNRTQLRLDQVPVTIAPNRVKLWGRAWLRFSDTDVRCTVQILRWTPEAIGVELNVDERVERCWEWRGAVTPLELREEGW